MKKSHLVVIGNGMAGMRTLEELLKIAPDLYHITVFGAEPYVNYNRILLSPVLAGEQSFEEIVLNDAAWYAEHHITLHLGAEITAIDRHQRTVRTRAGVTVHYDRLLLATGSKPFMLPIPGAHLRGVIPYRDIDDTQQMITRAASAGQAVVIGGGLLGLEAANGLKARGMSVTVVHLMETLMERNANTYEWEPSLAKEYSVSKDMMVFEFTLRDGIKWQDGKPLTVEDVKFSFDVIMDPRFPFLIFFH